MESEQSQKVYHNTCFRHVVTTVVETNIQDQHFIPFFAGEELPQPVLLVLWHWFKRGISLNSNPPGGSPVARHYGPMTLWKGISLNSTHQEEVLWPDIINLIQCSYGQKKCRNCRNIYGCTGVSACSVVWHVYWCVSLLSCVTCWTGRLELTK